MDPCREVLCPLFAEIRSFFLIMSISVTNHHSVEHLLFLNISIDTVCYEEDYESSCNSQIVQNLLNCCCVLTFHIMQKTWMRKWIQFVQLLLDMIELLHLSLVFRREEDDEGMWYALCSYVYEKEIEVLLLP